MSDELQPPNVNRNVLRELVAGLSDGIILLDPEGVTPPAIGRPSRCATATIICWRKDSIRSSGC